MRTWHISPDYRREEKMEKMSCDKRIKKMIRTWQRTL
jgi:hypothetical protein